MKKRVNYLINTKYQIRFATKFAIITTLLSGFVGFQLYAIVWPVLSRFVPEETVVFITHQIFSRAIIFLALALLMIVAFSIVVSHRVAGPIFAMHRVMKRILNGEAIEFVTLRKNDEFQSFAKDLNRLIAIVKETREPPSANDSNKKPESRWKEEA